MKNPPILISVIGFFGVMAGLFGWSWACASWASTGSGSLATSASSSRAGCGAGWPSPPGSSGSRLVRPLGAPVVGLVIASIVAGISLFEAVLAFFQFPGTGVGFAMGLMPLIILLYLNGARSRQRSARSSV